MRIKWYSFSSTQTASVPYLVITKSSNFMTLASLPIRCFGHHILAEISVRPQVLIYEFQLYIFSGTIFRTTAQPCWLFILQTEILLGYVKHTKLCCLLQRHITSLSWDSHAMLTVIDTWVELYSYWTVFVLVIVLLWQSILSQTTKIVTELEKIKNDTQYVLSNFLY